MYQHKTQTLHLDSLTSGIPALTFSRANSHREACIWCLVECNHSNGVGLETTQPNTKDKIEYSISWNEESVDLSAIQRAYNEDDGPEDGAVAIALLIVREFTDYTALKRSVTKTGIDYWLCYKSGSSQIFGKESARLEVSGILKENAGNTVKRRRKKKIDQTKQSDDTLFPVYVVVVEFSKPKAEMVLRNVKR